MDAMLAKSILKTTPIRKSESQLDESDDYEGRDSLESDSD